MGVKVLWIPPCHRSPQLRAPLGQLLTSPRAQFWHREPHYHRLRGTKNKCQTWDLCSTRFTEYWKGACGAPLPNGRAPTRMFQQDPFSKKGRIKETLFIYAPTRYPHSWNFRQQNSYARLRMTDSRSGSMSAWSSTGMFSNRDPPERLTYAPKRKRKQSSIRTCWETNFSTQHQP